MSDFETDAIRVGAMILEEGPIILEHQFGGEGRPPKRMVIETKVDLVNYLCGWFNPGDTLRLWSFEQVCQYDNLVLNAG